jgi:hypothetical protein
MNNHSEQSVQSNIHSSPRVTFLENKLFRRIAVTAILLAGVFISTLVLRPASRDFISYWSAAKLLVHHADPYSSTHVFALEKAQGDVASKPDIMRNPPWAMFLVAPLAVGSPMAGLLFWTLAAVGCVFLFARLLNVSSKDRAFAFVFAPAVSSIISGQSSPFLLLGFALFMHLHRSRPFLAGASLLLMAIKPHLFLVFWAVLLVDGIYRRTFKILAGGASAIAVATTFAICLDPRIWPQYFAMLRASALEHERFPTASMLFRMLISANAVWLLFIPSVCAILWALWDYVHKRQVWDWDTHGMLLMVVAVATSPYGWFTDSIVLLPSIMFVLGLPNKSKHAIPMLMAINTGALLLLFVFHPPLTSVAYAWLPGSVLAWFLYATRKAPHVRVSTAQFAEATLD